jgi:hypothetical protein
VADEKDILVEGVMGFNGYLVDSNVLIQYQ